VLLRSGVETNVGEMCRHSSNDNDPSTKSSSHQQVETHETIKGKHVRGPVKHIDRAIAKVAFVHSLHFVLCVLIFNDTKGVSLVRRQSQALD